MNSHRESDDSYRQVVVILNESWRIVECNMAVQWILQRAKNKRCGRAWASEGFCRSREALIRLSTGKSGQIEPSARTFLDTLPTRFEQNAGRAG
ncbi:hypothetical protein B5P45_02900 [Phyllobacterium zundukense]|uniref:Uncharacterized protein n=1 Tax=Phyllobacterium zundukense TaxID=1867719 RepID=A0A2N9W4U3_9HYPH|nr:hypothetical protein BLM14_09175 [Phyllobacterium zundukense]PIO46761.1 hypothetical protein B5P45_02900 [Phyllobacterium zundukense]